MPKSVLCYHQAQRCRCELMYKVQIRNSDDTIKLLPIYIKNVDSSISLISSLLIKFDSSDFICKSIALLYYHPHAFP